MRILLAALLFALPAAGQPAWLVPYGGAAVQVRTSAVLTESTYEVSARPVEVIAHYRKLFESAGLPFIPALDGVGTVIRAAAPECDLLLKIREQPGGTSVRVSCAAKSPALTAVPATAPPLPASIEQRIAEGREHTRKVLAEAEQQDRKRLLEMEKFDKPVPPQPKQPAVWPSWLVGPDGEPLPNRRVANALVSQFVTPSDRAAIQSFYAALLDSHACPIAKCPYIHIEFSPSANGTQVTLRVTQTR